MITRSDFNMVNPETAITSTCKTLGEVTQFVIKSKKSISLNAIVTF